MTDHLEPYRRMVRSIRFVPQLGRNQNCYHPGTQSVTPVVVVNPLPRQIRAEAPQSVTPEPVIDPSEHIAKLVKEAVSKPTVLPIAYVIQENIGDRISRMAPAKTVTPIIPPPKIPQPDPNWTPSSTDPVQLIELDWRNLLARKDENSQEPAQAVETTTALVEPVTAAKAQTSTDKVEEITQQISPVEPPLAATASPEPLEVAAAPPSPETAVEAVAEVEEITAPPASEKSPEVEPVVVETSSAEPEVLESPEPKAVEIPEAAVATVEEKDSKAKAEDEIHCPACDSTELRKNGHRNDKQRYICKDCGKQFVAPEPVTPVVESSKSKQNAPLQASATKKPQSVSSVADTPATTSLSPGKNKKKPKGFGGKKAKK